TIADPDGSNWQVINKLDNQYYDLTLSKSNDDQYFAITTANYEGFIINNSTATILQLNPEILYRHLSFSPNNTYLLAETIDADYHPSLQYSLLQNINFQPLNITTYLAKTTWLDDNNFVVAIPNTIPTTTFNDLLNTTDRIKQVNISENSFQILEWNINNQTSEGSYALSANSNYLYLLDKSNYLYFIPKTN
ncbi:MAG TPA: hypothetical protein PLH65_01770, partial [bacterium]|nr:hypothetical protein [bacterium]